MIDHERIKYLRSIMITNTMMRLELERLLNHAYDEYRAAELAGLRDGRKREQLTEVPKHVLQVYYKDPSHHPECLLAALNAYIAGPQPTPAHAAEPLTDEMVAEALADIILAHESGDDNHAIKRLRSIASSSPAPAAEPTSKDAKCSCGHTRGQHCNSGDENRIECVIESCPCPNFIEAEQAGEMFADAERECRNGLYAEAIFSMIDEMRKRGN